MPTRTRFARLEVEVCGIDCKIAMVIAVFIVLITLIAAMT